MAFWLGGPERSVALLRGYNSAWGWGWQGDFLFSIYYFQSGCAGRSEKRKTQSEKLWNRFACNFNKSTAKSAKSAERSKLKTEK